MKHWSAYILIIVLVSLRCSTSIVSGGGETTNGHVIGTMVYENGLAAPNTIVTLIKAGYNPVKDGKIPDTLIDTTDVQGAYSIRQAPFGKYTIQAVHIAHRTRALITGILLNADTITVPDDTLKFPGAIEVFLPDTIDTINGYVYIEGSMIHKKLSASTTGSNGLSILLDSVPVATIPSVQYARTGNPDAPVPITDTLLVTSNDTAATDAFVYWANYTKDNTAFPGTMVYDMDATPTTVVFATDRGIAELTPTGFWIVNTGGDIGLPTNTITSVCYQVGGLLWAGTSAGAATQKINGWQAYTTSNSGIPTNRITDIHTELINTKNVWFGTEDSGLLYFDGSLWIVYDTGNSDIPSNYVSSVCRDRGDTVWCTTQGGVFKLKGSSYSKAFKTSNSAIPVDDVHCMIIDQNRNKWFGYFGGVVRFNEAGNTWTPYTSLHSVLLADSVLALAESDKGELWVGTKKGLCMFDGAQWHDCTGSRYQMLANNEVRAIVVDSDGNKWIGTASSGVIAFGPTIK